jgi:hypothetical protein
MQRNEFPVFVFTMWYKKEQYRQTPVMTSTTLNTGSSVVTFSEKRREKATQNKLWMITLI